MKKTIIDFTAAELDEIIAASNHQEYGIRLAVIDGVGEFMVAKSQEELSAACLEYVNENIDCFSMGEISEVTGVNLEVLDIMKRYSYGNWVNALEAVINVTCGVETYARAYERKLASRKYGFNFWTNEKPINLPCGYIAFPY